MRLACENLVYAYGSGADVLRGTTLSIDRGEVIFVLGSNGSGKTTLLECLAGVRAPRSGRILLDGDDTLRLSARERARRIGLVPQIHEPVFDYTVGDVVLMGRSPHLGLFGRPSHQDRETVEWALRAVEIESLRDRRYTETSGGERQLALIARGLAQGAGCLLMDEPGAHLDPHHRQDVFRAVSRLSEEGLTFLITSHQPNHALLYGDRAALLMEGRADIQGPPAVVLTEETLRRTYGIAFDVIQDSTGIRAILPHVERGNGSP